MGQRAHQRNWEDLSVLDPCWAILSDPSKKYGGWDMDEFFRSGELAIERILSRTQELGVPLRFGSALDFGCGAGRLTRALAAHFETTIGVDISSQMIAMAERFSSAPGCRFVVNTRNDLALFEDATFDFVYTELVLQHLPSRAAVLRYISEFVRVLKRGGMLAFQLPSHIPLARRAQLRPRLYGVLRSAGVSPSVLYRRLRIQPIRMNAVGQEEIRAHLGACGATILDVDTVDASSRVKSSTYFVSR